MIPSPCGLNTDDVCDKDLAGLNFVTFFTKQISARELLRCADISYFSFCVAL